VKIDAHQHFWQYNSEEYGWIGPSMEVLRQDWLPADLVEVAKPAGVEGTVAVQARQCLDETLWLLELADSEPAIQGVVGWVDLQSPGVKDQLAQLAVNSKLRGVRHVVQDEPDDEFMLHRDFQQGIAALADWGLTYDILIFARHLPAACEFVARFPDQPFVLDHMAKPPIEHGLLTPWDRDIRRLAAFPNVCCKVSGLITEADPLHWQPADFWPYLDVVFEAFGTGRLMFGSDWPVCTLAGTYSQVTSMIADYVSTLSEYEQANLWADTAKRFYGLVQDAEPTGWPG
jgi:L-fuconolactonase